MPSNMSNFNSPIPSDFDSKGNPFETDPAETGSIETGPAETDPAETAPVETGPVETGPAETGPVETGPAETDNTQGNGGEQTAWTEIPWVRTVLGEDPVHSLWLAAAGIALGAVLAVVISAIVRRLRKKEEPAVSAPVEVPDEITGFDISVEKLHEQGARKNQQDCFAVSPLEFQGQQGVLAMVADGMGGLANGDKVSQAAVTAALNAFFTVKGTPGQILLELLSRSAEAVNRVLGSGGMRSGGTTMVMGLIKDSAFHYLSVGDSRICLYRGGVLYQLNREHTYRNELAVQFVNGDVSLQEVGSHPKGGGLTSYLGMGNIRYVDLPAQPVAVRPGDRFILMCDGVYNALTEQELTAALDAGDGAVADALRTAIQAKNYANQDNYTAVILEC